MHCKTNPLNKKLLQAINDKIPESSRGEYFDTVFLKEIFSIACLNIDEKIITLNDFYNFIRWAWIRQILKKKREKDGRIQLKINPDKFDYYLWRLKNGTG